MPRGSGQVWRKRKGSWELHSGDLENLVFKVWNGWFVGDRVSWRLEGDELVPIDNGERLLTVRGRAADEVFAVAVSGFSLPSIVSN